MSTLRPFYFMVVFWGPAYRRYFTELLLPSLLSPNNLPGLRRERRNRFLIVTTREDWEAIQEDGVFRLLATYAEPIWVEMECPDPSEPKMLVMSRGHKRMAARAFEERAYGVFLSPEMVFSDGSVATMERLADAGKKVVLAVAIRFQYETIVPEMERQGYLKSGQPLVIGSRDLMRIALRNLHSETLRYEFDAPWFAEYPVSVYWWVPRGDGIIIHSFSWASLVVDYGALAHHDTSTFENWTVDGNYIFRNFPNPSDICVVTDSDELALVTFTKELELHFDLVPYLAGRAPWIATWYKLNRMRALRDSEVMDPLKRRMFPTPVYLHAGEIAPVWERTRLRVARLIKRVSKPPGRIDKLVALFLALTAPDLGSFGGSKWRVAQSFPGRQLLRVRWLWRYRRFVWQRVKERVGLAAGRSRLDDGRDWVSPALGLLNPIWSLRMFLREKVLPTRSGGRRGTIFPLSERNRLSSDPVSSELRPSHAPFQDRKATGAGDRACRPNP